MAEQEKVEQPSSTKHRMGRVVGIGIGILVVLGLYASATSAEPSDTTSAPEPITTQKEVHVTEPIPFQKVTQNDGSRDAGTSAVTTPGANGVRTKTFRVTYVDDKETARELISEAITTAPVNEVTSIGTRQPYVPPAPRVSSCDPNYSGCVPIASDVDCSGGSGNGPAYVSGPVRVIGSDIYGLDRDGNGLGCE